MTLVRLLAAMALVALFAGTVTLLTHSGGRGGLGGLMWVAGVPIVVARLFDPRRHAWVVTAVWLVICSVAVVASISDLAKP